MYMYIHIYNYICIYIIYVNKHGQFKVSRMSCILNENSDL